MEAESLLQAVEPLTGCVTFHASSSEPGTVNIDLIKVDPDRRRSGHARRVLTAAAEWADQTRTVLTLTATPTFGSEVGRLYDLYSNFGFIPTSMNRVGEICMRRPCQEVSVRLVHGGHE